MRRGIGIGVLIPSDSRSDPLEEAQEAAMDAGMGMLGVVAEIHEREAHAGKTCIAFRLDLVAATMVELGISPKILGDPVVITRMQKEMLDYARSGNDAPMPMHQNGEIFH